MVTTCGITKLLEKRTLGTNASNKNKNKNIVM
jgi:hypothetical protein